MTTCEHKGTAVVTGASRGIGALYADRLARRGYDLILVARNRERLASLAGRIADETRRSVEVIAADLTNRTDLSRIEARLRPDAGITMLVNNAGVAAIAPLLDSGTSIEHFPPQRVMSGADLVDAALAGFDLGEFVTIPSLPDIADWDAFEAARRALYPNISHVTPAARYRAARRAVV
jgi:hypothetical protein